MLLGVLATELSLWVLSCRVLEWTCWNILFLSYMASSDLSEDGAVDRHAGRLLC